MRKKSDVTEVKEIEKLAETLLEKPVLEKKDLDKLDGQLNTVLAQFGVFPRYFRRLSS
jgi:hypothetical protein